MEGIELKKRRGDWRFEHLHLSHSDSGKLQMQKQKQNKRVSKRLKRCEVDGGRGIATETETETESERRSWNDMNHDILVNIMLRLSWKEWAFVVCYICQSWLSALLDALFPVGNRNLDLTRLESMKYVSFRRRFRHYIKLVLDRRPQPVWTRIDFANIPFHKDFYRFLAQRLPLLRVLVVPKNLDIDKDFLTELVPYWLNLRVVHAPPSMVLPVSIHCKFIYHLSLYGVIEDDLASLIATEFPLLQRLELRRAFLTRNALSLILDGHKNLEQLDTTHCYRLSDMSELGDCFMWSMIRIQKWNEEEICQKASAIKIYLRCAREHCPECYPRYLHWCDGE